MKDGNKWKRHTKDEVKQWKQGGLIALGLALLFLLGGLIGIIWINAAYREYTASEDVRTVEATITNVTYNVQRKENEPKEETWTADLVFEVDGKQYWYHKTFGRSVEVGDKETVKVYRDPEGDYRIPTTGSGGETAGLTVLFGVLSA